MTVLLGIAGVALLVLWAVAAFGGGAYALGVEAELLEMGVDAGKVMAHSAVPGMLRKAKARGMTPAEAARWILLEIDK